MTRPIFDCEFLENRRLLCHVIPNVAVIGDSYSADYQLEDLDGLNFVEQLGVGGGYTKNVNFGPYLKTGWPTSNTSAFKYNFAVGDATITANLTGEVASVLPLVSGPNPKVQYVTILLGGNDFEHDLIKIKSPAAKRKAINALPQMEEIALQSAISAIETAAGANHVEIAISTLQDLGPVGTSKIYGTPRFTDPTFQATYGITPAVLDLADADQNKVNNWIRQEGWMVDDKGRAVLEDSGSDVHVVCVDFQQQIEDMERNPTHTIDGRDGVKVKINTTNTYTYPGTPDNPRDLWLGDGEHPGTVEQALWGNLIVEDINAVNTALRIKKSHIDPLGGEQILEDAGFVSIAVARATKPYVAATYDGTIQSAAIAVYDDGNESDMGFFTQIKIKKSHKN